MEIDDGLPRITAADATLGADLRAKNETWPHPARANRRAVGDGRTARMNETGWRIDWPPARITRHAGDIGRLGVKAQV